MSIIDKKFLKLIVNTIPDLYSFEHYDKYLSSTAIQSILLPIHTTLLSHIVDSNNNDDNACFLLYKYDDKFILIHIFNGTCSGCFNNSISNYRDVIIRAIDKAYITTNKNEMEQYYLKCLSSDCDFISAQNIYYIFPQRPYYQP